MKPENRDAANAAASPRIEPGLPIFRALGSAVVRFRFAIVAIWVLGVILAVATLPSLASVTDNNNSAFLPKNSQSVHAAELAAPFQHGTLPTAEIVASRANGPLTAADQAAITRAEATTKAVPGVVSVLDQGVSRDGQARKADVTLVAAALGQEAKTYIEGIRAVFTHVGAPAGLNFDLTGETATLYDANKSSQNQQSLTELFSLLFIIVLLLVVYRSALAPFLTLLPAALVLVLAQPVIAESHKLFGVEVSPITSLLMIVLLLGAGTDYGLFLVFRVREEMRNGLTPHEAVIKGVARVGETITFSAATVMGALLCLLLATFGFYQGLGPALAIGIGLMLLSGLTLLPAILAIFSRAAFWPSTTKPGTHRVGLWGRVAASIVRRPKIVLTVGLIFFGALALGIFSYSPSGFGSSSSAASTSQSSEGTAALNAHFPAAQANPTNLLLTYPFSLWNRPAAIATANASLAAARPLSGVSGPLDPNGTQLSENQLTLLHRELGPPQTLPITESASASGVVAPSLYNAYRSTAQFISADGKTLQFYATLTAGDPSSTKAMNAVPDVLTAVRKAATDSGATNSGVAGEAAASYDISSVSDTDLVHIVPVVLLVIGLLLVLVMRSLVAPWYLLASVGVSYLASIGLAVIVFVIIGRQAGLSFFLPFLLFIFLLALGEDYNILVMTRIREEAHYYPIRIAVARAINATGSTVTSAGMVLAGSFLVLTLAGGAQVQQIGFGIAAGIMMDTFLVRTLLIPSTVALLGHWNWWPSRMFREEPMYVGEPVNPQVGASES